jgi:polysaccharide pyruvyl transferase WcaK-like protein
VAYIGGWLGHDNLGDEALLLAAKLLFKRTDLWPYAGSRIHNTLMARTGRTKFGLLAGGTLINRLPEWYQLVRTFLDNRRDAIVFGTGVANPAFWTGRGDFRNMLDEWAPVLSRCIYVGVRGPLSAGLLKDAGVPNVEVIGDPVLAFAEKSRASNVQENVLGLNIGYAHGFQWGSDTEIWAEAVKLARLAHASGFKVKWFVVYPRDEAITREAAERAGAGHDIICIYRDPMEYLDAVRPVTVFAGMKLHATALATCAYVPSLMLEYQPKCRDYMSAIGQNDAVIRTDQFRAEPALELLSQWARNRAARSEQMFNDMQSLARRQWQKADELSDLVLARHRSAATVRP